MSCQKKAWERKREGGFTSDTPRKREDRRIRRETHMRGEDTTSMWDQDDQMEPTRRQRKKQIEREKNRPFFQKWDFFPPKQPMVKQRDALNVSFSCLQALDFDGKDQLPEDMIADRIKNDRRKTERNGSAERLLERMHCACNVWRLGILQNWS
jgi:hypothetical protein